MSKRKQTSQKKESVSFEFGELKFKSINPSKKTIIIAIVIVIFILLFTLIAGKQTEGKIVYVYPIFTFIFKIWKSLSKKR